MRLPLPFLLYTTSICLVGFTGWQVKELLPLRGVEAKTEAQRVGVEEGTDLIAQGRTRGAVSANWYYTNTNRGWWERFQKVNFIGKLPPPVMTPEQLAAQEQAAEAARVPPKTPLEEIIELRVLVYDSADDGRGELSHVVVRYLPTANVTPPDWYLRELEGSGGPTYTPGDGAAPPMRTQGNTNFPSRGRGGRSRGANAAPTPMPMQQPSASGPYQQELWVKGGDDKRRQPNLWPPYEHIRLVRVSDTAQSAFFVRTEPSPEDPAKTVVSPEERLIKTVTGIPQDVLTVLENVSGSSVERRADGGSESVAATSQWVAAEETTQIRPGHFNVGRQDSKRFADEGTFLESVSTQPYVSRTSSTRGILIRNVKPELAASFGVAEQDVLIAVNGYSVKTEAEAIQFGKREYKKGVRTFVTEWLSAGQKVTRTYNLEP